MRMSPADVIDVLDECAEFLDNYVDVNDGEDGQPVPNRAMSLKARCEEASAAIQREQDRVNHEH